MRRSHRVILFAIWSSACSGGGGDAPGDTSAAGSAGNLGVSGTLETGGLGHPAAGGEGGAPSGQGGSMSSSNGAGSAGAGGSTRDSGVPSVDATVPVVPVTGCEGTPSTIGVWQDITPRQLNRSAWCIPGATNCPGSAGSVSTYGSNGFLLDPTAPGTIYLGTASLGIWKSTNCGKDWIKIDTGTNSDLLDAGRNHVMLMDPRDSKVIYSTALYNNRIEGVYQSKDGGVNWAQIVSAEVLGATAGGFFSSLSMDPTDPDHLVASPHTSCSGTPLPGAILGQANTGGGWGCLADGHFVNGSWSWTLTTNGAVWGNSDGGAVTVLGPKRWLYNGAGVMLTTTGGVPPVGGGPGSAWTSTFPGQGKSVAYISGVFYKATSGTIYSGGPSVIYSTNNGDSWAQTNSLGGAASSFVDDGTTMYVSTSLYYDGYFTSPISKTDPTLMFTAMAHIPAAVWGGFGLRYDPAFHSVYSTNLTGGFWRVVLK